MAPDFVRSTFFNEQILFPIEKTKRQTCVEQVSGLVRLMNFSHLLYEYFLW